VASEEDLYVLEPPDRIERRAGAETRSLERARWNDLGPGRAAAAALLLADATGRPGFEDLVRAFVLEVLAPLPGNVRFVIAVREVRAWREEREPEVVEAAEQRRAVAHEVTLPKLLAQRDSDLARPPLATWLDVYRAIHGPPSIDPEAQEA
jgi:hypothetical protein